MLKLVWVEFHYNQDPAICTYLSQASDALTCRLPVMGSVGNVSCVVLASEETGILTEVLSDNNNF